MMGAGSHVFAVMSYVIAKTVNSRIELNPKYLAVVIGDTEERMQAAIDYLCSPDPRSTHDDFDGRRLIPEGRYQYFVPMHELYRSITTTDDLKEANRRRVARHRDKKQQSKAESVAPEIYKDSPEFQGWWVKWLEHLKDKRKPPTAHAQELQLAKLEKMGLERALAAIKFSIEGSYQGLFEPSSQLSKFNQVPENQI